ncbi:pecanex-like protein 4, partial [Tropilaelaps mercedesae]
MQNNPRVDVTQILFGIRTSPLGADSLRGCRRLTYWLLEAVLFLFPFVVGGLVLDSLVREYYLGFFTACGLFAAFSFLLVIIVWQGCNLRRMQAVAPEYEDKNTNSDHRKVVTVWTTEMLVRHLLWLGDCIALHSLAVESPVETATFEPPLGTYQETWHQPLMRPFYLGCLVGCAIFLREVPVDSMDHVLVPLVDVFICLLPLLWLLGVLAPLDALKLWAGEWISTTVFGGSPTPSEL